MQTLLSASQEPDASTEVVCSSVLLTTTSESLGLTVTAQACGPRFRLQGVILSGPQEGGVTSSPNTVYGL